MQRSNKIIKQISGIFSSKKKSTNSFALASTHYNWDDIVKVGSSHLVLPTIYSRLKSKNETNLLPKDLVDYLDSISSINRNRNLTLIEESKTISNLFNEHHINHVFVKGIALLASNHFEDSCERMVGDIDILVDENQINKAFDLLQKHNYSPLQSELQKDYLEHRHMDRLIPKNGLGAIELHQRLLRKNYKDYLNPSKTLKTKRIVNGINIPNNLHLLQHAILDFQINDYGNTYNSFSLKNAYDSLTLLKKNPETEFKKLIEDKLFKNYFIILGNYFEEIPKLNLGLIERFNLYTHQLKQDHTIISKTLNFISWLYIKICKFGNHLKISLKHPKHFLYLFKRLTPK